MGQSLAPGTRGTRCLHMLGLKEELGPAAWDDSGSGRNTISGRLLWEAVEEKPGLNMQVCR